MDNIATEHLTKLAASYLQAAGNGLRYAFTPELDPTANAASARGAALGGVVGAGLGSGVAIGADALDGSLDPTPESYLVAPVIGGVMGLRAGSHAYDRPPVA